VNDYENQLKNSEYKRRKYGKLFDKTENEMKGNTSFIILMSSVGITLV
jgi:hypothetical protein